MSFIGTIIRPLVQRAAKRLTLTDIRANFETSAQTTSAALEKAADTPRNRNQANHVIGIERWGQQRLNALLGQPLVIDEYDSYRPGESLSLPALREIFLQTRQETLSIIDKIAAAGVENETVPHNDLGDISAKGWLYYLESHATREGSRISSK
jgi:hypothetical protein